MFKFVKKLKPYLFQYKKQVAIFLIVISISLILEIIKIFWTVDLMEFNSNTPTTKIVTVITGIAIFTIVATLCSFIGQMTLDFVAINVFEKVRKDIYKHISNLKVDFAQSGIEGDFLVRWASDLQTTQNVFMTNITSLILSPVAILVYTIYLVWQRWDLFLISFLPVVLTILVTDRYGKYVGKQIEKTTKEQSKLNDIITDSVICSQIVKIYRLYTILTDKYKKITSKIGHILKNIANVSSLALAIQYLMWFDIGSILCYAYGGYLFYKGEMSLAGVLAFKFIFSALTNFVLGFPTVIANFRSNIFYINRVFDIFDYPIEELKDNKLIDIEYKKHIEFKNVSYKNLLKDCSFEIKKGERVAIVGERCKTTILNLLCGFYAIDNGSISICGYYINNNNLKYIRNKISIVPQEPTVFLGSIKENIICGYEYDAKRFENITKIALINDFAKKFSNEYNTSINGQGGILSGGQCQRLNLARALYKDSEILLLDNYTSALDNDTKKQIYNNMKTIKDRTIIVFSNNVFDLEQVDRVILLKDGQVYKEGKHDEILKECSYYREILNKDIKKR